MEFGWNWAGLAVLFSSRIKNGCNNFLLFFFLDQDHLLEMKTVEIHALAFLAHIILNLAGVISHIRTRLF